MKNKDSDISNSGNGDKIEDWIDSFQSSENDSKDSDLEKSRKSQFRDSYLTYLKLLSQLKMKTKLHEEEKHVSGREDIIFPPSHSLSQTDREYFNIVRTEDGQSQFAREQDRERLRGEDRKVLEKFF